MKGFEEVITSASVDQTIEILQADSAFDLILLDYQMPGMNGLKGLEQLLSDYPGVPICHYIGCCQCRGCTPRD